MRTFLCVPIDGKMRDRIAVIAQQLRTHVDAHASWVPPENYHLTVRFLGEIDPMLTVDLKEACREIATQVSSFDVPIDRVGGFPSLDNPRVLWVGGKAPDPFRDLLSLIDYEIQRLGFPHRRVESIAHITLARIKGRLYAPLSEAVAQIEQPQWALHADRLVLMESLLTARGAIYSPLFTLPFAKERDVV